MTPTSWSRFAFKWYAYRLWFMAIPIVSFGALALVPYGLGRSAYFIYVKAALVGPLIVLPWGLFCACIWFHPQFGKLHAGNRWAGRLPEILRSLVRWYAAIFLLAFIVMGVIGLPIFVAFGRFGTSQ